MAVARAVAAARIGASAMPANAAVSNPATPAAGALPYRLVIFDFDGTLADSGDWFLSIADELADRFDFKRVEPAEVEGLRGRTTREVIRYLGIPRWKLPKIGKYVHALLATQTDRISLFEGVVPMIHALSAAGIRIALVTSNAQENACAILGHDLASKIEWFECGASLFGKARRYRKVLKRSKFSAEEAISIGDETRDITAARKVGIATGAVMWGYANREALSKLAPDALFQSPAEVQQLLLANATN